MIRIVALGLCILFVCAGCRAFSYQTEYGVNLAPDKHGMLVPTYQFKFIVKE